MCMDGGLNISDAGGSVAWLDNLGYKHIYRDFRNKEGSVTQTILAKIDIIIHNQDKNTVNLYVTRSFSQHLFSWMNDAASRL